MGHPIVMASEREFGQILEAMEQGKRDRSDFRESMSEMRDEVSALRESISAMRADFLTTTKQANDAVTVAARVNVLEARVGEISNDVQAMQSFLSLAKRYSIWTVISVLSAIALGATLTSKVIDWIFGILHR